MTSVPYSRPALWTCAAVVGLANPFSGSGVAEAQTSRPSQAVRNAAMSEAVAPGGVGGCVYFGVTADTRRAALLSILSGEGAASSTLQAAVAEVAPRCTGRPYSQSDLALVGAVTSTFRRTAAALALAQQYGVGQRRLDAAWGAGGPTQKAAFYAVADDYLSPSGAISSRPIDVSPFADSVGISTAQDGRSEALLRMYLTSTALSERAEAALATQGVRATPK